MRSTTVARTPWTQNLSKAVTSGIRGGSPSDRDSNSNFTSTKLFYGDTLRSAFAFLVIIFPLTFENCNFSWNCHGIALPSIDFGNEIIYLDFCQFSSTCIYFWRHSHIWQCTRSSVQQRGHSICVSCTTGRSSGTSLNKGVNEHK